MGKIRVCADPEISIQAWYCTSRWQQSQRPFFPVDFWKDDLTDGFLDSLMDPFLCQLDDPVDSDGRWSGQFLKRNTRIRKPLPGPVTSFFRKAGVGHFSAGTGEAARTRHWHHHLNMALSADCW